jgi:hypothetical protein
MDRTDQITRQTGLVPDVQAIEALLCRNGSFVPTQSLPSFSARSILIQKVIGFDLRE